MNYENWDPMKNDYFSFGNLLRFQAGDNTGALISGHLLNSRVEVCPFSGPGNTCYKGDRCPYKYHVDSKLVKDVRISVEFVTENPKIGIISTKERIFCLSHLPQKPVGREGMMSTGVVTAVVNPGEFYIVPNKSWECACKSGHEEKEQILPCDESLEGESPSIDLNPKTGGIEALNEMIEAMSKLQPNERNNVDNYAKNELVAVSLGTSTNEEEHAGDTKPPKKLWFRAVVAEDTILEEEDQESPHVLLTLIDIGVHVLKSTLDVIRLPRLFCHLPPLAYKCSLYGISPISHRWSKSAIETFKQLLEFQPCIFEVKRTIQLDDDGPPTLFEKTPYLVDINFKLNNVFYNATHCLASEGFGIKWNFTPSRPLVSSTLDGELWSLLEAENISNARESMKCSNKKIKSDHPHQNIITREIKRMNKLLGRLNISNVNDDDAEESDESWNSQNSSVDNTVDDILSANNTQKL